MHSSCVPELDTARGGPNAGQKGQKGSITCRAELMPKITAGSPSTEPVSVNWGQSSLAGLKKQKMHFWSKITPFVDKCQLKRGLAGHRAPFCLSAPACKQGTRIQRAGGVRKKGARLGRARTSGLHPQPLPLLSPRTQPRAGLQPPPGGPAAPAAP